MHACVTVWHGVVFGIPAVRAASLATLLVLRLEITVPKITLSIRFLSMPVFANKPCMAIWPNS